MIVIMTPGELGSGPAEASRWTAQVTSPRVLILAAAALMLTNIPFNRYGSGGHPNYFWSSLGVLLAVWRLWDHQRFVWAVLTASIPAALVLYGLSIAGVINTGLPGWWIPITGAADLLALAILLSPPIRGWVAKQPAPSALSRLPADDGISNPLVRPRPFNLCSARACSRIQPAATGVAEPAGQQYRPAGLAARHSVSRRKRY